MSKFQRVINNKGFTPLEIQGSLSLSKDLKAKPPNGSAPSNTKINGKFLTGFTLVEMLVAMAIFVIVVAIISGLFVHAIQGQRRNLAYQELLDQTSYVMEYMSRSIRMAMKDDIEIWGHPLPPPNCLTEDRVNYEFAGNCLKFRNYKDECQQFCRVDDGGRFKLVEIIDGTSADLTSTSSLDVLSFNVTDPTGSWQQPGAPGDNNQPLVAIFLRIKGRENTEIQIQTSISQRNLDTVRTLP